MTVELGYESPERSALHWLQRLWNRAAHIAPATGGAAASLSGELQRRPLAVAGIIAGAGLMLGSALASRARSALSADRSSEEIIARALCREDPDTPTHRGPLWTGYRKDARRVLAALRHAGLVD